MLHLWYSSGDVHTFKSLFEEMTLHPSDQFLMFSEGKEFVVEMSEIDHYVNTCIMFRKLISHLGMLVMKTTHYQNAVSSLSLSKPSSLPMLSNECVDILVIREEEK